VKKFNKAIEMSQGIDSFEYSACIIGKGRGNLIQLSLFTSWRHIGEKRYSATHS